MARRRLQLHDSTKRNTSSASSSKTGSCDVQTHEDIIGSLVAYKLYPVYVYENVMYC